MRAASSVRPGTSGGVRMFVAGPAMEKNIKSTPMPAANSIAAQVKRLNLGLEWSGPSFVRPRRVNATMSTKTTTMPAVAT